MVTQNLFAQTKPELKWDQVAKLPAMENGHESLGFAGIYAGEHNGVIIMAGGANFPDGLPWEGGKKYWWNEIYILQSTLDGFEWIEKAKTHLPESLGYGAAVSTPDGLLIIGGENSTGPIKSVYLLAWNATDEVVNVTKYPDLPIPLSHSSAAIIRNKVYLAGGESRETSGDFWVLDLSDSSFSWEQLPSWPGAARSNASLIAQNNATGEKLYLMGGRKKTESGVSELFSEVFLYDPSNNTWSKEGDILNSEGQPLTLSAFQTSAVGSSYILVFGGVTGENFSWLEEIAGQLADYTLNALDRKKLIERLNKLLNNHPGFSKDVLAYHTVTKCWTNLGELLLDGPVNTMAVPFKKGVIIPSGEIFPGIRSPYIYRISIVNLQVLNALK